jgi:hypothetical protein
MRQAFTRLFLILIVCSFVVSIGRGQSINPDDKNWDSRFTLPCTDGRINSMIGGPDGALYIGGDFNYVEGLLVKGLAKWDGHHWSRVGNWRGGYVRQMLFWKSELYVGGYLFGSADSNRPVAKYDGTSWFPVGNSIWYHDSLYTDHAQVNSLTIFRGDLWLAGSFNTGAGKSYEGVAILRDSFWQAAKAINSGPLYLGGIKLQATDSTLFLMVGVSAANGGDVPVLKQFTDFGDWLTVDSNSWLAVTASYRNTLIATGNFHSYGLQVGAWNGTGWVSLGTPKSQPFGSIAQLYVDGPNLFVVGSLQTIGTLPVYSVAKWNGKNWSRSMDFADTADGRNFGESLIAKSGSSFYSAHQFFHDSERRKNEDAYGYNSIMRWVDTAWVEQHDNPGLGLDAWITTAVPFDSLLYLGGSTTLPGATTISHLFTWNGANWSSPEIRLDSVPLALASIDGKLYVSGKIHLPAIDHIVTLAAFDGTTWSLVDSTISVRCIVGRRGKIFLTDDKKLYSLDAKGIHVVDDLSTVYPDILGSLVLDSSGRLFSLGLYGGVYLYNTSSWIPIYSFQYSALLATAEHDTLVLISRDTLARFVGRRKLYADSLNRQLQAVYNNGTESFAAFYDSYHGTSVGILQDATLRQFGSDIQCDQQGPILTEFKGDLIVTGQVTHAGTHPSYGIAIYHRTSQGVTSLPSAALPLQTVSLFPNPASEIVNIRFENGHDGPVEVSLSDELGRQVYSKREFSNASGLQAFAIPVNHLTNGVYRCVVTTQAGKSSGSFVVMR